MSEKLKAPLFARLKEAEDKTRRLVKIDQQLQGLAQVEHLEQFKAALRK